MAARYFTKVSNELLAEIRAGVWMPDGLRLVREAERYAQGWTLVEFDDDGAPAEMEGANVEPYISAAYGEDGQITRTWISARNVVERW